ncbi:hypothetical protein HID58_028825 [Brassica napus]|uniref:Uncharacterized protein n=1 Tax=Brassica napus TaxID=3708 RepID=A0ABQ8CBC4_BRANA|nr:hypothetical protein HID58_028825 [Brassica napus]
MYGKKLAMILEYIVVIATEVSLTSDISWLSQWQKNRPFSITGCLYTGANSVDQEYITGLKMALSDLQTLQNMEIADGSYSHDKFGHYRAVCDDLKTRLMGATKQFDQDMTKSMMFFAVRSGKSVTIRPRSPPLPPPPISRKSVTIRPRSLSPSRLESLPHSSHHSSAGTTLKSIPIVT